MRIAHEIRKIETGRDATALYLWAALTWCQDSYTAGVDIVAKNLRDCEREQGYLASRLLLACSVYYPNVARNYMLVSRLTICLPGTYPIQTTASISGEQRSMSFFKA